MKKRQSTTELILQLVCNFVLPIFILTRLSAESSLGPTKAFMLALAFPILFELYNIIKNKKISWISVVSIGGILVTGALGLLSLDENWLAVRRSAPYLFVATAILVAEKLHFSPLEKLALQVLDMKKIAKKISDKSLLPKLFKQCSFFAATLFSLISVISFTLTKVVITAPTNSPLFNQQYAQLRLWSIAFITLPILLGFIGVFWYIVSKIEKETNLSVESILRG